VAQESYLRDREVNSRVPTRHHSTVISGKSAGKAKAGMVHSVSGWTWGVHCRWNCEIPWERVSYLSALEVWSWQGAIQIHVYLYFLQVIHTRVPVSPSSIICYWPKSGDALRLESKAWLKVNFTRKRTELHPTRNRSAENANWSRTNKT